MASVVVVASLVVLATACVAIERRSRVQSETSSLICLKISQAFEPGSLEIELRLAQCKLEAVLRVGFQAGKQAS